jgi:hypothetical protein
MSWDSCKTATGRRNGWDHKIRAKRVDEGDTEVNIRHGSGGIDAVCDRRCNQHMVLLDETKAAVPDFGWWFWLWLWLCLRRVPLHMCHFDRQT